MKKVLLVFPGLRIKNDEGAKHRLNSFINAYHNSGCEVTTLAFYKGSISHRERYLNKNCSWLLMPYILPLAKSCILSHTLLFYLKTIVIIVSWIKRADIVQMEVFSLKSCLCYPKSKYYVDFHGDSVYEYVETGRGSITNWFSKLMLKVQKESVINTHKVICVTTNLKEQIEINTNNIINNCAIISCGVDLNRFKVDPAKCDVKLDNKIIVGYCGGLQKWQNIEKILDIVLTLREIDKRIFFFLFTNSDVSLIKGKLHEIGEENYCIKALKSVEVPAYLKLLDAGFLIRDNFILNKVSSPTKISEYLAAGAGLICTRYSGDYKAYTSARKESVFVLDTYSDEEFEKLYDWLRVRKTNRLSNDFLNEFTFDNQFEKAKLL